MCIYIYIWKTTFTSGIYLYIYSIFIYMCVCVHPVIDASMVLQAAFYVYIHSVYSPLQPMSCPANLLAHSQHHPQTWRENIFGKKH